MKNWKTLLFLALFATGFAIEMFKADHSSRPHRNVDPDVISTEVAKSMVSELGYDIESIVTEENETVAEIRKKAKKFQFKRKGSNDWFPNAGQEQKKALNHDKAIKKLKKDRKKNGKKIVKKKKQERPLVAETKSLPVIPTEPKKPEKSPEETQENTQANATGGIGPSNQANSNAGNNREKSLEEWEDILLRRPSPTETNKFIEEHRLGNVSKDTYYKIAEKMLSFNSNAFNDLAVRLYGQIQSVEGFIGLASVVTGTGGNFSSGTIELANKFAPLYRSVDNLKILKQVISIDADDSTKVFALSNIQESLDTNTRGQTDLTIKNAGGTFNHPTTRVYQDMIAALLLLEFSPNADLGRRANDLRALLANQFGFDVNINTANI